MYSGSADVGGGLHILQDFILQIAAYLVHWSLPEERGHEWIRTWMALLHK
jgi:hypothetical protein